METRPKPHYHEWYQPGRGRVGMPDLGYVAECSCGAKASRRIVNGHATTVYMAREGGEWLPRIEDGK